MASSDRALALDVATTVAVAVAACALAAEPRVMLGVVLGAFVARTLAWRAVVPEARAPGALGRELAFLALSTLLGAANDWNTVDRHGVYGYGVPTDLPGLSTIPAWMLLYWGLILRSVATLASWRGLGEPTARDEVHLPGLVLHGARWRVAVELALVLATRQAIYRLWDHPLLSWLPFAAALALYALLLRPGRRERALALTFAIVGPVAEALLIGVGGLHHYALGWLFGVPLWIALWWVLAVLIWADLAPRLRSLLPGARTAPA